MRRSIVMLILTALVLSGCLAPKASAPAISGSLKVLVLGASGLDNSLVKAFGTQYPKVTVELVPLPDGSFADVLEAIRTGASQVDVIIAPGSPYLFQQGVVAPLGDRIRKAGIDLANYGHALEMGTHEGKLYGLPVTSSPMVLVYNKEALEAAGVALPSEPWSWEQFGEAARTLADHEAGKPGAAIPPWVMVDLLVTAGQGLASDDLTDLESRLTHFRQWMVEERVLADFALGDSESAYYSAFGRGEFPMVINYWGNSFGHAKPTFTWTVAPLPGSGGSAPVPGTVTLAMQTANAANPDAAFNFVQVASSQLASQAVAALPGSPIPGHVNDATQRQWLAHSGARSAGDFMLNQRFVPPVDYPEMLIAVLLREVDLTLSGDKAAADAIRDFQQARQPFLSN